MIRSLLSIFFILSLTFSFGQNWRDSLSAARSAYENKEFGDAFKHYQSTQKIAPDSIDFSDEMAQSAYKAREFEKASEIYKQGASNKKSVGEKADAYHNLGNSQMKKKDYGSAIESYKESLRQNPNDEQTRYNLSEAIRQLSNQQKQQKNNSNDNKNQNKQDENKGDQKQDQKKSDENKNGDSNNSQEKQNGENKSKLPNKTVERLLDKLMKEEAETKRKASGSKGGGNTSKSGKDW